PGHPPHPPRGSAQATTRAIRPAALTALVRDHGASRADFASLRLCRSGSDRVALELEQEFTALAGLPIDEGYGMTEVGIATINPPSGVIKAGSIGRPVPGFAISIPDDTRAELPPALLPHISIP